VARAGEGSVRDSQTLMDQVISYALGAGEKQALRAEDVLAVLGGVQEGQAWGALKAALRGDASTALTWLQEQYQRGADLRQVLDAFQSLLRGLLLLKAAPAGGTDVDLLPETVAALTLAAPDLSLSRLFTALKACAEAEQHLRYSSQTRLVIELLLIKLAPASPSAGLGEIVDELRELEQKFRTQPAFPAKEAPAAATALGASVPAGVQGSIAPNGLAPTATAMAAESKASRVAPAAAVLAKAPPSAAPEPEDAGEPVPAVLSVEEAPSSGAEGGPSLDVETLRKDWEAVVADVQNVSINLASAAKDAGLMALEGGTLTLKAINGFQRQVLDEPAERVRLEHALSKRYGRPLKVRIVFSPPAGRGAKGGKPGEEEIEKLLKERPEVRRVQELFGAEIVEIRED